MKNSAVAQCPPTSSRFPTDCPWCGFFRLSYQYEDGIYDVYRCQECANWAIVRDAGYRREIKKHHPPKDNGHEVGCLCKECMEEADRTHCGYCGEALKDGDSLGACKSCLQYQEAYREGGQDMLKAVIRKLRELEL